MKKKILEILLVLINAHVSFLLAVANSILAPVSFLASFLVYSILKNRKKSPFILLFLVDFLSLASIGSLATLLLLDFACFFIDSVFLRLTSAVFSSFMITTLIGLVVLYILVVLRENTIFSMFSSFFSRKSLMYVKDKTSEE